MRGPGDGGRPHRPLESGDAGCGYAPARSHPYMYPPLPPKDNGLAIAGGIRHPATPGSMPTRPRFRAQTVWRSQRWSLSLASCGPVGLILGIVSLNQIKTSGEQGRGMALAGVIIGTISIVFWIAAIAFWI